LLFYAVNFLLFAWIVKRFGGTQIRNFFKTRAKTIRATAHRAQQAFNEAQILARRASDQLKTLEAEKSRIAAEMAEETAYQVKRIQELTRETTARIERDVALSVAAAREAGQRRLREALAAATGRLARDLIQLNFQPADQTRLLETFVSRLGEEARS
jgi:F-type H+-transporting ATPase subunit b